MIKLLKNGFLGVVISVIVISCGTTVRQLNTNCNESCRDIFKSLTTVLLQENFKIIQNDVENGYLQAETEYSHSVWTGANTKRVWIFQYDKGKIIASAKEVSNSQNAFGATVSTSEFYYSDRKAHEDMTWYWRVRNELEKLCTNIKFTERKAR